MHPKYVLITYLISFTQEPSRMGLAESPVTQKFLVGTVPCLLTFSLDNTYSWMREKLVSYKITITPPSRESLAQGRQRRAQACLTKVQEDLKTATLRLSTTAQEQQKLDAQVRKLEQELEETRKAAAVAHKEHEWLVTRQKVRQEQEKLLQQRLEQGWPDEK